MGRLSRGVEALGTQLGRTLENWIMEHLYPAQSHTGINENETKTINFDKWKLEQLVSSTWNTEVNNESFT